MNLKSLLISKLSKLRGSKKDAEEYGVMEDQKVPRTVEILTQLCWEIRRRPY